MVSLLPFRIGRKPTERTRTLTVICWHRRYLHLRFSTRRLCQYDLEQIIFKRVYYDLFLDPDRLPTVKRQIQSFWIWYWMQSNYKKRPSKWFWIFRMSVYGIFLFRGRTNCEKWVPCFSLYFAVTLTNNSKHKNKTPFIRDAFLGAAKPLWQIIAYTDQCYVIKHLYSAPWN